MGEVEEEEVGEVEVEEVGEVEIEEVGEVEGLGELIFINNIDLTLIMI